MSAPFTYPDFSHQRRHGPRGYANYEGYRPWLRDEFSFRCVYCLLREQWGRVRGIFDLDHFLPACLRPDLALVYENLLYSCATCNAAKGSQQVPDPGEAFLGTKVSVGDDGIIQTQDQESLRLIRVLGLNDPEHVEFRLLWIGICRMAQRYDSALYQQLLGFPRDLPNLGRCRPPGGNTRPQGIQESYFRQRVEDSLPATY